MTISSQINPVYIDANFPVPGQDNDTQTFRTNFATIKTSLYAAQGEITGLMANVYGGATTPYGISVNTLTLAGAIQFANLTTAQVTAISTPACGMTVYNFTTGNIQVYNGTNWANVTLS